MARPHSLAPSEAWPPYVEQHRYVAAPLVELRHHRALRWYHRGHHMPLQHQVHQVPQVQAPGLAGSFVPSCHSVAKHPSHPHLNPRQRPSHHQHRLSQHHQDRDEEEVVAEAARDHLDSRHR